MCIVMYMWPHCQLYRKGVVYSVIFFLLQTLYPLQLPTMVFLYKNSDDHHCKIQNRDHKITTDPGPRKRFQWFFNTLLFMHVLVQYIFKTYFLQFQYKNSFIKFQPKIAWSSSSAKRVFPKFQFLEFQGQFWKSSLYFSFNMIQHFSRKF